LLNSDPVIAEPFSIERVLGRDAHKRGYSHVAELDYLVLRPLVSLLVFAQRALKTATIPSSFCNAGNSIEQRVLTPKWSFPIQSFERHCSWLSFD
jgi:hypothetical protein